MVARHLVIALSFIAVSACSTTATINPSTYRGDFPILSLSQDSIDRTRVFVIPNNGSSFRVESVDVHADSSFYLDHVRRKTTRADAESILTSDIAMIQVRGRQPLTTYLGLSAAVVGGAFVLHAETQDDSPVEGFVYGVSGIGLIIGGLSTSLLSQFFRDSETYIIKPE